MAAESIAESNDFLMYRNQSSPVWMKSCSVIAAQTVPGRPIFHQNWQIRLQSGCRQAFKKKKKQAFEGREQFIWSELFQFFLMVSLVFFLVAEGISEFAATEGVKG